VAVQADGEIVVGGGYAGVDGIAVLRITPGTSTTDAVLDLGFGGGDGIADVPGTFSTDNRDVAVGAHGKILLTSQVPVAGGSTDATVVRLTAAGTVDDSFGSATGAHVDVNGGADFLDSLAVLPGGGVVAVGDDGVGTPLYVVKLRATGAPDLAMGAGGVKILPRPLDNPALARVAALPHGRIIVVGTLGSDTGLAYRLLGDLTAPSCGGKKATIVGTKAADHLVGTRRADVIASLGGRDDITGLGKGDIVCGGQGDDHIAGRAGADRLYGQAGADALSGGKGADKLLGGTGHDTFHGGPGHDTVRQ
jgi:Ca2+-binding RTX toxin-like protein